MLNYAVCEIGGKQYKVVPAVPFDVNFQKGEDINVRVLLISEGGKLKLGNPYLKDSVKVDRVSDIRGKKIRVAKFHAKANYRKVKGHRAKMTRVVLSVKNS